MIHAFFNLEIRFIESGIIQPNLASFEYTLFGNSTDFFELDADLWLPLSIFARQSFFNILSRKFDIEVSVASVKNLLICC